jgi:hypothetical protein
MESMSVDDISLIDNDSLIQNVGIFAPDGNAGYVGYLNYKYLKALDMSMLEK